MMIQIEKTFDLHGLYKKYFSALGLNKKYLILANT